MKNFWKWILGIVIVLVVFFGLGIGARLLMGNLYPAAAGDGVLYGLHRPMMGGRGFDSYGGMMSFGGGMTFGWLVPVLLVGALVYGAFYFGSRRAANQAPQTPAVPDSLRTCPKCGHVVQQGWNHCAACGRKL